MQAYALSATNHFLYTLQKNCKVSSTCFSNDQMLRRLIDQETHKQFLFLWVFSGQILCSRLFVSIWTTEVCFASFDLLGVDQSVGGDHWNLCIALYRDRLRSHGDRERVAIISQIWRSPRVCNSIKSWKSFIFDFKTDICRWIGPDYSRVEKNIPDMQRIINHQIKSEFLNAALTILESNGVRRLESVLHGELSFELEQPG